MTVPITVLAQPDRYIREDPSFPMWHLDGVAWHDARPPFVLHRHWPQTVGVLDDKGEEIHRCACGALRWYGPGDPWIQEQRHARRRWLP